jgi:hypothetical protein
MINKANRCLRDNIDFSRNCERWSIEEEEKLVQSIINKKSFEEIALEHKRSITAVKSRLYNYKVKFNRNILKKIQDNITEDSISKFT